MSIHKSHNVLYSMKVKFYTKRLKVCTLNTLMRKLIL